MSRSEDRTVEETYATLEGHVDAAIEHASDAEAVFHLRHAKQLLVDYPTLVGGRTDTERERR